MKPKQDSRLLPANILNVIFKEERRSGLLLIFAAVIALCLANSSWSHVYEAFVGHRLTIGAISLDMQHWISEGLMAIFFFVVVLEIKREFIDGELSTWRKASFPVIAAVGGMLLPALIYSLFNTTLPESKGWAIPIATDIAIAVGILAFLGKRIPRQLRIFLLALAIVDDIGSIIIISLFYSQPSNALALIVALVLSCCLIVFRKQKYWPASFLAVGLGIWYCLMLAGISGTVAGVIIAALAPLTTRKSGGTLQLSERVEDILLPLTAYIIVPLFVFTSTGLVFENVTLAGGGAKTVFFGVLAGLLCGKPLGIILATWLSTKMRLAQKPASLSWWHIGGAGFLAGIGFTISLFVADLSFGHLPQLRDAAITGVFIASILGGIIGSLMLRMQRPSP